MRILPAALGASLLLAANAVVAQPPLDDAAAGELELRRVMLSTGGVGYFEYETRVSGDAALSFRVRRDQVDDVLKSVVVYDDEGRVGAISLPGQEPLREAFRSLPIEPEHLASPAALFNALRGAEVRVSGAREIVGRLLSVTEETVTLPDGERSTRHRVSLVGRNGVQQVVLEEAGAIALTDAALAAQLETALAAVARLDDSDSRTLTVAMDGGGAAQRTVRVAYVVEVPLWKATYRLTLADEPSSPTASLQGWAVLENLTGRDWQDVELTIVSGNPVTFRQALYEAYYTDRPEVPVEVLGRVLPRVDTGAIDPPAVFGVAPAESAFDMRAQEALAGASRAARAAADSAAPIAPLQSMVRAAESAEAAAQVLFRIPQPVTIAAGESVLVPIIAAEVPARRVSVYQPDTHPRHPLASVVLTNDTATGLPPGVLTLYERSAARGSVSHVGDARLAPMPAEDERLLSFAVDQEIVVDREDRSAQRIQQGRIVDGVLQLTVIDSQTTRYLISAAAGADREVVLEHPRRADWELADPPDDVELTETAYRIPLTVAAGETARFDAVLERPRAQRVELAPLSLDRIQVWAANRELSDDIRAALRELAELRAQVAERERELDAAQQNRTTLVTDQARIRDNLAAVPSDSDLARRYLAELTRQEDRLGELDGAIENARAALEAAQQRVAEYVRALSL